MQGRCPPECRVFHRAAVPDASRLPGKPVEPAEVQPIDHRGIKIEAIYEMIEVATACEAHAGPSRIGERAKERFLEWRAHAAYDNIGGDVGDGADESAPVPITVNGRYDLKSRIIFADP